MTELGQAILDEADKGREVSFVLNSPAVGPRRVCAFVRQNNTFHCGGQIELRLAQESERDEMARLVKAAGAALDAKISAHGAR